MMGAVFLCAQLTLGQTPAPAAAPTVTADDALTAFRDDTLRQRSRLMFEQMAWGEANLIVSGLAFLVARGPFARGFELQLAVWGVVEAAAAAVSLIETKRDSSKPADMETWLRLRDRTRHDARLDALVSFGALVSGLVSWRLHRAPRWRGMAAGLVLQCGFLTVFNLLASLVFRS
jgi:hypothetical protein